jgi:hypothetical protein
MRRRDFLLHLGGERINSLDPTTFRYQIHSRELES